MAKDTPIELSTLVAPAASFGEFLGSFLDTEKEYIEYLREGRKRYFFITSYSAVGTKKSPYVSPAEELVKDPFKGTYFKKPKKPKKGQRVGRDGRTSSQRLADIKRGPRKPSRFKLPKLPELPKLPKVKVPPQAARIFGRSNAILNTITAGLEFSSRIESGQSLTKATLGTTASVVGGIAGASFGATKGAVIGGAIGAMFGGLGAVPGAVIGGAIGAIAGGFIGSSVASGVTDFATDAFGLEEGGVIKSSTKSVIAETGIPEWLIPFDEIGKILIDSVFKPIGSVMIGAASSLMSILPTSTAMLAMKGKIAKLKGIFGIEKIKPAIPGAVGGYNSLKTGIDAVIASGMDIVGNFFGADREKEKSRAFRRDPSPQTRNTTRATGKIQSYGLSQEEAFRKIYDIAVSVGGAKFPELVAAIAMVETGWLQTVGGNNPYNQRAIGGQFINYGSLEEATREHIAFWHEASKHPENANNFNDPNEAFAKLVYAYAPPEDNNKPEQYKQSVANMIASLLPKMTSNPKNKKLPPKANKNILSKEQFEKVVEKWEKFNSNPGVYLNNSPVKIIGVGTMLVGTDGIWPAQTPVVKYFNVNGEKITEKEWLKALKEVAPQGIEPATTSKINAKGGSGSMNLSLTPPSESQPVERDVDQLNLPPEKRDQESMDTIEENSFSFVPIVIPGQTIPIQNIIEKVKYDSDTSYFDPISHGVKTGRRIVL